MSEPKGKNVVFELTSALSALHMEADELPKEELPEDDIRFMDERLLWVNHARKHILSALARYDEEVFSEINHVIRCEFTIAEERELVDCEDKERRFEILLKGQRRWHRKR